MKTFIILALSAVVLAQNGMAIGPPPVDDGCPPQNGRPVPKR